eukprot:GHRR01003141.1.p1 GENE.GHRR01003141.1~~GHRR01003141.1.p1  ORF type:complete len:158 (-),score=47.73 GHRR01003141.1:523-996(-)
MHLRFCAHQIVHLLACLIIPTTAQVHGPKVATAPIRYAPVTQPATFFLQDRTSTRAAAYALVFTPVAAAGQGPPGAAAEALRRHGPYGVHGMQLLDATVVNTMQPHLMARQLKYQPESAPMFVSTQETTTGRNMPVDCAIPASWRAGTCSCSIGMIW